MGNVTEKLRNIKKITDILKSMSAEYVKELVITLSQKSDYRYSLDGLMTSERFADGRVCPYCKATHIVRNGHRKSDGVQRYVCRGCGKSFVATSNSIVSGTDKDYEVWRKYVECMMDGLSIRRAAEKCGIHRNTAFAWRHKILDALQEMQDSVVLTGIVEADEKYVPISYKGNHKNSRTFVMPREARKHGHKIKKLGLTFDYACIPCAVNRKGESYAKVGKAGRVGYACLENALGAHIQRGVTLCTDREHAYRRLSRTFGYDLVQVGTQEVRKGIYHIQHINSYHSLLESFLYQFRGVATKYLNNYLVWHNFVDWSRETYREKCRVMLTYCITRNMTVRCRDISSRKPTPFLA